LLSLLSLLLAVEVPLLLLLLLLLLRRRVRNATASVPLAGDALLRLLQALSALSLLLLALKHCCASACSVSVESQSSWPAAAQVSA
jgi:hypothetical protein